MYSKFSIVSNIIVTAENLASHSNSQPTRLTNWLIINPQIQVSWVELTSRHCRIIWEHTYINKWGLNSLHSLHPKSAVHVLSAMRMQMFQQQSIIYLNLLLSYIIIMRNMTLSFSPNYTHWLTAVGLDYINKHMPYVVITVV